MKKRVYLSGGFVTGWQEEVMNFVPEALFYNPQEFEMPAVSARDMPASLYAPMDEIQIRLCDILFGYLEASNPTPINVIAESCYAKGLGKVVILCNEWNQEQISRKSLRAMEFKDAEGHQWFKPHYMDMVNHWVDFCEPDFGRAKELLKRVVLE